VDLMNIQNLWIVFIGLGAINVLWTILRPSMRPPEKRNRWIESRSRSDSK
jgi:hypothetical protein